MRINSTSSLFYPRNCFSSIQNKNLRTSAVNIRSNVVIDSLYGGNKEITKEDALMYKYWQDNPLSIFDKDAGSKMIHDVSQIPKEYMDHLNNTEITEWDKNRLNYALDFSIRGSDIDTNLNRLAATYVTTLEHLTTNFSGEKLENYKKELESIVSEISEKIANHFSQKVGSFLEENGVQNETGKIYDSIMSEYHKKVSSYIEFAENNKDYAHLKNSEDRWLINDIAYMSQQLQKVAAEKTQKQELSDDHYSLKEISLASRMIDEVNQTNLFSSLGNEESVGMEAGILLLKTKLFSENEHVSEGLADKMTSSIKGHIRKKIEQENNRILSMYDEPYYDKDRNPIYDISAIYAVSDRFLSIYQENQNDYHKTILEGIKFAQSRSAQKEIPNGFIDRYKDNKYWDYFFDNSAVFSSKYYQAVKGYDSRTEFAKLLESWNQFSFDITGSDRYCLKFNNTSYI